MLLAPNKTTRAAETRPPVVVLLPAADDRGLIQLGLAVAHGDRTRLRAWTFNHLGAELHPALRIALYGMTAQSEADRAVRHLVDSAVRGAHVAVRPLGSGDALRQELDLLASLPEDTLLLVGRVKGRAGLAGEALEAVLDAWRGPLGVAVVHEQRPVTEILALSAAPHEDPAHQAVIGCISALERAYPTFRVRLADGDRLTRALGDVRPETAVVAAVDDEGLFGTLAADPPFWNTHAGTTLLIFPPEGRRELRANVLSRLSDDESPPPPRPRAPLRWSAPPSKDDDGGEPRGDDRSQPPSRSNPESPSEISEGVARNEEQETP